MIELLSYPPLDCATQLAHKMIDRINADRIAGKVIHAKPMPRAIPRKDLPKLQPDMRIYPNPPMTHREAFGLFGEYLD